MLLPAPLGPTSATRSPGMTRRVTPCRAAVLPNCLLTLFSSKMGVVSVTARFPVAHSYSYSYSYSVYDPDEYEEE